VFRKLTDGGDTINDFAGNRAGKGDHLVIDTNAFGGDAGDTPVLIKGFDKPAATGAKETVLYATHTGQVFYDPGAGPHHAVLIATLANHAALHINDVLLI
jgi:hypothetical protein